MKLIRNLPVLVLTLVLVGTPFLSYAQPTSGDDVIGVLENIVKFMGRAFWVIAIAFILIAAFTFLFAAGDAEKVKRAKKMLFYAVIAIIVALFANGAGLLIQNILGGA